MLVTGWRSRESLSAARRGESDMASAVQKVKLSPSRDIPFNKLALSQSNVRRVKAGVTIEQLAESIAQRTLLQSLSVRAVIDADGQENGMFEVPVLARSVGLDAGTSSLAPDAAFAALMEGNTILELAEGLRVRRTRVMGVNRIELTGFTETMRDLLRAYGLFGEIISWKLRFFVPVDATGPAILAAVLERYPIARVADRTAV
jgi:hypothetical protein